MSKKFDDFITALDAMCREHQCKLSVSMYDGLDVWDLLPDEEPIHCAGINDKTSTDEVMNHIGGWQSADRSQPGCTHKGKRRRE